MMTGRMKKMIATFQREGIIRIIVGEVYGIKCKHNGRIYVGASRQGAEVRFGGHRHALRKGKHDNLPLQLDWNEFGPEGFGLTVLQVIYDGEDLRAAEREWQVRLNVFDANHGYNLKTGPHGPYGPRKRTTLK